MNASLRRALLIWLLPTFLAALAAGLVGTYLAGRHAANIAYDEALMAAAEDVALAVHTRGPGPVPRFDMAPQSERMLRNDARDRLYFAVRTETGDYIGGDSDLPVTPIAPRDGEASVPLKLRGESVRALTMRFRIEDARFVVTVAETLRKRDDATWTLVASGLLPVLAVLLAIVTVGSLAVRQGLMPLAQLRDEIEARSAADLSPVELRDVPLEVRPLVVTLNALFERLRHTLEAQRHFAADTAHQLRTPLAGIQSQIELLPGLSPPESAAAMERLRHAVLRAVRLTQQLLALGRAQGDPSALRHGPVDMASLVSECASEWVHRGIEADVDVGFELEPAWTTGDRDLLVEMIENLVDNAFAHAKPAITADGNAHEVASSARSITVTTHSDGAWTRVMVDDSGRGIPEADRERVFQRFVTLRDRVGPGGRRVGCVERQRARARHRPHHRRTTPRQRRGLGLPGGRRALHDFAAGRTASLVSRRSGTTSRGFSRPSMSSLQAPAERNGSSILETTVNEVSDVIVSKDLSQPDAVQRHASLDSCHRARRAAHDCRAAASRRSRGESVFSSTHQHPGRDHGSAAGTAAAAMGSQGPRRVDTARFRSGGVSDQAAGGHRPETAGDAAARRG